MYFAPYNDNNVGVMRPTACTSGREPRNSVAARVTVHETSAGMDGCEYTLYTRLAKEDPKHGGGDHSTLWVYISAAAGDQSKCTSWGNDCCASNIWGEPQTCSDGYVPILAEFSSDPSAWKGWPFCPDFGKYTCVPGDDSKCTSTDGGTGYDCCASDEAASVAAFACSNCDSRTSRNHDESSGLAR